MTDKIAEESMEIITGMKVMTEAGTGPEKGHFPEALTTIEIEVKSIVGPGQDQEPVQIDRIRCKRCREYDHLTQDCPTS